MDNPIHNPKIELKIEPEKTYPQSIKQKDQYKYKPNKMARHASTNKTTAIEKGPRRRRIGGKAVACIQQTVSLKMI